MTGEVSGWELAYRDSPTRDREIPHEDAASLHELFQKQGVRRILDLGCGDGRHLTCFGKLGYEMCGLDCAPTALRLAKEWLTGQGLSAGLACAEMSAIPWPDGFFDAVISFQVINHGLLADIRRAISEVHRILGEGGWLFVTLGTCLAPGPVQFRGGYEIEPRTYVLTGHPAESGIPHHFFTTAELVSEFSRFRLADLHWDSRSRACLLARKSG